MYPQVSKIKNYKIESSAVKRLDKIFFDNSSFFIFPLTLSFKNGYTNLYGLYFGLINIVFSDSIKDNFTAFNKANILAHNEDV